jgi:hypothetical protein
VGDGSLWRMEGEFFFVLDGTTYFLSGKGYRSIEDFLDGRAHGFKGSEALKAIRDSDGYSRPPRIWREILDFRQLDQFDYRPSEGDVFYFVRNSGFEDLKSFLEADAAKPPPPHYV